MSGLVVNEVRERRSQWVRKTKGQTAKLERLRERRQMEGISSR
jgi:hypothetical protein